MPARDIYEQLDKLREAIHQVRNELPATGKASQLEECFGSLEAAVKYNFEDKSDFSQRLEAEIARLFAPFNERLNNLS